MAPFRLFLLASTILSLGASAAWAQQNPLESAGPLETITVTATRNPEPVKDVPATVSVIDAEQLERMNAQSPADAVRYEPGVSVGNQPARGGSTNYTIRGIGDNRILLLIDGVEVPDLPGTNTGAGTYTRDFVDLDAVKRIEIVRGPASALYGSDAIGGVVAYATKDPADYLDLVGKDWYLSGKVAYDGADDGVSETATGAYRVGRVEALALFTRRDGQETSPAGDFKANPQDSFSNNFLGKLVYHINAADTLKLTGEYLDKTLDTNALTDRTTIPGGGFAPSVTTLDSRNRDTTERSRVSVDYTHDEALGFIDRLAVKAYYSNLDRTELTRQLNSIYFAPPPTPNTILNENFQFQQHIFGGELQLNSHFTPWGIPNELTYGVSGEATHTSHPRYGTQTDIASGTSTNDVYGETFPDKNFPDTDTTKVGGYLQDKITLGRLSLLPAVRVDYYHLEPHPDAAFDNSNGGVAVRPLTATPVSPKFGITYQLTDVYTAFAGYSHGFRAPPYDNANFGFRNPLFGYEILPSPNLKSEKSDGGEIGLRGQFPGGSNFSASGFYNHYSNFIDATFVGFDPSGLMEFQYVNLSKVTIYGAEARGEWHFLPAWSLQGSAAYARGEDDDTHAPIDSVDPIKLVAGLTYTHPTDGWGGGVTTTHAWRHYRVSDPTYYQAHSYTTVDLAGHYDMTTRMTLNGGIFNLTDARYFNSQDVAGVAANSSELGLYAQPGRTVGLNATVRF